jgi:flagellar protein FlaG
MATDSMASITSHVGFGGVADETNKRGSAEVSVPHIGRQGIAGSRQGSGGQTQVSREKIDKVVSELKDFVQTMQRDLNFHVDDTTGHVVIRVVETSTDKVVRQIPEEEVLDLALRLEEMLDDMPKGVLLEGEA